MRVPLPAGSAAGGALPRALAGLAGAKPPCRAHGGFPLPSWGYRCRAVLPQRRGAPRCAPASVSAQGRTAAARGAGVKGAALGLAAGAAGCTSVDLCLTEPASSPAARGRAGWECAALLPFCLGHGISGGFSKARGDGGARVEVSNAGRALGRRVFLAKTFPRRPLGRGPGVLHEANFSPSFLQGLQELVGTLRSPPAGSAAPLRRVGGTTGTGSSRMERVSPPGSAPQAVCCCRRWPWCGGQ